jgi:hypothetical protein
VISQKNPVETEYKPPGPVQHQRKTTMFELKTITSYALRIAKALVCHRAIYTGLAICHSTGCFLTEKPELYGPMAILYAALAVKG